MTKESVMSPITIVLTQGYSDWEIAVLAGTGKAFFEADIRFASADGGAVTSVGGIATQDLERFEAPGEGVVVVCGGSAFEGDNPPDLSDQLVRARDNGCVIAGICGVLRIMWTSRRRFAMGRSSRRQRRLRAALRWRC
jgi:putative intracellular protease/amidase